MNRPNFFIVGAPKCGTTALFRYLQSHPDIYIPGIKEPCYFSGDFPGEQKVHSHEEYLELFTDADPDCQVVGEASVWYLYSSVAIKNIFEFNKSAKIVVMLRNPLEQVYSMHQQCLIEWYDTEKDFIRAWRLQEVRKAGKKIPRHCTDPKFLQYREIASYSEQIERLLSVFPRDQVKFLLFEDLKSDPRKMYLDVLSFLGLDDDNKQDFLPKNESKRHRMLWLGAMLAHQPHWLEKLKSKLRRLLRVDSLGVRELVSRRLTVNEKRKPLPTDFVSELKNEFRADVEQVSSLIGRDLSHWTE